MKRAEKPGGKVKELLAHVGAELKKPEEEISDELVSLINSRIRPPKPVTGEQIFIRTMFLVSDQINSYGGRFPLEELHRIAELAVDSPVMVGHAKEKLPIARNFKAEVVQRDGHHWVKAWFYWMKNAKDAASMKENVDHGIYKECSLGFVFEMPECSICGRDMRRCRHVPFKSYPTEDGEREAYFNYRNVTKVLETSLVYRGAVPNTSMSDELGLYWKPGPEKQPRHSDPSPDGRADTIHEISPLEFVSPTRTHKSASASNEIFNLESLSSLSGEFLIEPKYDGVRVQIHKSGEEARIFSDGGTRIEHRLPHLVKEILLNARESFILDGELVKYKGNSRLPRKDVISHLKPYLHDPSPKRDGTLDDSRLRFKLFDLIYLDGEDRTSLPLEERKKLLEALFPEGEFVQMVSHEKVCAADLPRRVNDMSTSEGVMLKRSGSRYFEGHQWFKWKRRLELDVLVAGVEKNKGGSFNYSCAVEAESGHIRIGKTYSTSIPARLGEVIRVRVDRVTKDGDRFFWHAPKVLDRRLDKKDPDPVSVLERMLDGKPSAVGRPRSAAERQERLNGGQTTAHRFILQLHRLEDTEYHHLRLQDGEQMLGLTILELDLGELNRGRRFLCEWKDSPELRRVEFEGDIPPGEPGGKGNTRQDSAAHIEILDMGEYEILERKEDLVSLKIEGEMLNGIYLARTARLREKDIWLIWKRSTDEID
jgi:hypothetical protein